MQVKPKINFILKKNLKNVSNNAEPQKAVINKTNV